MFHLDSHFENCLRNLHSSLVQICPCFLRRCVFFSKVMEGLDFITLYVALSQGQVDSILGGVAMPQESSQRFGIRTNKEDAVHRSHAFAEWERLYVARSGEGGEVLTHKDFIVCTLRVYAIGYLPKEYWRSVGSDKANRVQMERRNST